MVRGGGRHSRFSPRPHRVWQRPAGEECLQIRDHAVLHRHMSLYRVAAEMRRMLKENGQPPGGRWADLALLEPVRDYKARHASTLLVFDALERALDQVEDGARESDGATTAARG